MHAHGLVRTGGGLVDLPPLDLILSQCLRVALVRIPPIQHLAQDSPSRSVQHTHHYALLASEECSVELMGNNMHGSYACTNSDQMLKSASPPPDHRFSSSSFFILIPPLPTPTPLPHYPTPALTSLLKKFQ